VRTDAQKRASRINGAQSKGPITPEGKRRSRVNARTHGLSSPNGRTTLLPGEDPVAYDARRAALLEDLKPVGAVQEEYAEDYIYCRWSLRRSAAMKRGTLVVGVAEADALHLTELKRMLEITERDAMKASLAKSGITDPQHVRKVIDPELHEHVETLITQALEAKDTDDARLAAGFIHDATGPDAMGKLSRYEIPLVKRANDSLEKLRELQAAQTETETETETATATADEPE
jgi:hypothetical protein